MILLLENRIKKLKTWHQNERQVRLPLFTWGARRGDFAAVPGAYLGLFTPIAEPWHEELERGQPVAPPQSRIQPADFKAGVTPSEIDRILLVGGSTAYSACHCLTGIPYWGKNRSMKVKTSITLSREVLETIDRRSGSSRSRSQFVEEAVRNYVGQLVRREADARDLEILNRRADKLNEEASDVLDYQVIR